LESDTVERVNAVRERMSTPSVADGPFDTSALHHYSDTVVNMAASTSSAAVRNVYRELLHLAKQQKPKGTETQPVTAIQEVRTRFRGPLAADQTVESRLKIAQDRLSFLRITTTKIKPRGQAGRWVYRNGQRLENFNGTLRDDKGRVHSSFDGKNMDPEMVSKHVKNLNRAGFVNNLHAKGIF
jgi:hypothetical protein